MEKPDVVFNTDFGQFYLVGSSLHMKGSDIVAKDIVHPETIQSRLKLIYNGIWKNHKNSIEELHDVALGINAILDVSE